MHDLTIGFLCVRWLLFLSRLMALREDKETGTWKEKSICMGDTTTCSFPGLINHHHKFIISFAEDEAGKFLEVR